MCTAINYYLTYIQTDKGSAAEKALYADLTGSATKDKDTIQKDITNYIWYATGIDGDNKVLSNTPTDGTKTCLENILSASLLSHAKLSDLLNSMSSDDAERVTNFLTAVKKPKNPNETLAVIVSPKTIFNLLSPVVHRLFQQALVVKELKTPDKAYNAFTSVKATLDTVKKLDSDTPAKLITDADTATNVVNALKADNKKLTALEHDNTQLSDLETKLETITKGNIQTPTAADDMTPTITTEPTVTNLLLAAYLSSDVHNASVGTAVKLDTVQQKPAGTNAVVSFDLNLTVGDQAVHLLGAPVQVTITLPTGFYKTYMSGSYNCSLTHYGAPVTSAKFLPNDTVTFSTDSFSPFSVVATPDKSALENLYNSDKSISKGNYTDASWAKFSKALQDAYDLLNKSDATKDQIDSMVKTLTDAKNGLTNQDSGSDNGSGSGNGSGRGSGNNSNTPVPSTGTFVSDTNSALSVNNAYTFKITSMDGKAPTFVVGTPGIFTVQLVKQSGNDYFYKITATGPVGAQAGIYVNGTKLLVATVKSSVRTFVSDTNSNLSVNSAYTFKITSKNGKAPNFVVGTPGTFDVKLVKRVGNDYYIKITAVGAPGTQAGIYINGGSPFLVATVGSNPSYVKSDTTGSFQVRAGKSYVFKLTGNAKPSFVAGTGSAFKVSFVKQSGKDYFFRVTAVGKARQASGFYINHQARAAVATIS